jgi:hypothetical protein
MRTIKLIIIALILGLAGIVYAAGAKPSPAQADGKEKAASCCDSCCMKEQKSGDAKAAHKSCDMQKEGCCNAKADCCQAKADCCKPGAECCKAGESCCAQKETSHKAQGKAQACDMQKDGKACCGASCECCKDESGSKGKMTKQ